MSAISVLSHRNKNICLSLQQLFCGNFKKHILNMSFEGSSPKLTVEYDALIARIRNFIPALSPTLAKGECGKIGIVGGSKEYTGAPYFTAMTSLKIGADLVYVFCSKDAGFTIKSYSPELIVLPILDDSDIIRKIDPWLGRLNSLVIGPGLGRDSDLLRNVSDIIKHCAKKYKIPLVIDADGLYLISENPRLLENYAGPKILTPNKNEFNRLSSKLKKDTAIELAVALNATIVQKGFIDIITNGAYYLELELSVKDVVLKCEIKGSNRRCGGQGDILAGCMATFLAWFHMSQTRSIEEDLDEVKRKSSHKRHTWFYENGMGYSLVAYAACCVTKQCSKYTFQKFGRSMTATDMLTYLHKSFKTFFAE